MTTKKKTPPTKNIPPQKLDQLVVIAKYTKTDVRRWDGNPLIEALPQSPQNRADYQSFVEHNPPKPTDATRRRSEFVRIAELQTLSDFVYSFPEYQDGCLAMSLLVRESYVARNPLTAQDVQRRHALTTQGRDGLPFPQNWKSSAGGFFITAVTGMGKTTLMRSFLIHLPQLIRHTNFHGRNVPARHQIVYLYLRIPHNGTLNALCLQFFREVDALLGTNYTRQARGLRNVALMVDLMKEVATTVSLSFIVVDELQNLHHLRGEHGDIVLDYLVEIIEGLGIGVISIATPAIGAVLKRKVRSSRKLTSFGSLAIRPMKKGDPQWQTFCELCWDYTYVRNRARLTKEIMDTWHDISAGNTAFAISAFLLTQRNEIGGREIVDIDGLERTAATDMAFLQPAIAALKSGKPSLMRKFDDLMFGESYQELQRLLGIEDEASGSPVNPDDEFHEVKDAISKASARKTNRRMKKGQDEKKPNSAKRAKLDAGWSDRLQMVDPLVR